jgi:fido (protein-threonine AMPylation protein)
MAEGWETRPGETPYNDLEGFIPVKHYPNPTRQQVDELEEENIRIATLKYLGQKPSKKKAPFDYYWFLELHREMYGDVWEWAGTTKTQNTQIGLDKLEVQEALRVLAADIQEWPVYFEPLDVALRIHHQAVQIHPFKNGNGRWSRLLSNIWLRQNEQPLTEWPVIVGESPIRDEYLKALREADKLNFDPLRELHERYTRGTG